MTRKIKSKQDILRERVYNFYIKHRDQGKSFTVSHFTAENISKATIYRIIERAENDSGHGRRVGSGRTAIKMTPKKIARIKDMFNNNDTVSYRLAARKLGISPAYAHKIIKTKSSIRKRKKTRVPKRSERQKADAKTKCGRLIRKFRNFDWVLDDETFFTLSHSTIRGNQFFYTSDVNTCPSSVKFAPKAKFEPKILLWLAISPKGISNAYFVPSGLAINKEVYLRECIIKRLIPFIKHYHSDCNYVFWPDLATSHYASNVQDELRRQNVNFVEKKDNPANVPEARPIEDFWAYLKGLVYEQGWRADNTDQLKRRIQSCLKKVDRNVVQRLAQSTRSRLDTIRRNGVIG